MANCYRLFVLNGPNGVTEVPVEGTVTSVLNRGDLSNINEIQIDGVLSFSLPMDHPKVSAILNSRWCPGAIQQEFYQPIWIIRGCIRAIQMDCSSQSRNGPLYLRYTIAVKPILHNLQSDRSRSSGCSRLIGASSSMD